MKKIIFFLVTLLCVFSVATGAEEPFLEFSFSTNASDTLKTGDVVECVVEYKNINASGLSSAELVVGYSEGLEFNNDAVASGLNSEWSLWSPNVYEDCIKLAIVDDSAVTPGVSDVKITFSFTVTSTLFSLERIEILENYIYDFDINEVTSTCRTDIENSPFMTNFPELEVENLGASLRINNTPALRFGMKASVPEGAQLGILVSKTAELTGELTHSSSSAILCDVTLSGDVWVSDIIEISSNTEKYTFRPFVILTFADSNPYFVYFDALERSAGDVARAALEVETDQTKKDLLEAFCIGT